jgi:hypothetical protein
LHFKQGKIISLKLTRKRSSLCSLSFQPPQLASVEVFAKPHLPPSPPNRRTPHLGPCL